MGLCLPFNTVAICVARRPRVMPVASTMYHSQLAWASLAVALYVLTFIAPLCVLYTHQTQPTRRCGACRLGPVPGRQHFAYALYRPCPRAHLQQAAGQTTHH